MKTLVLTLGHNSSAIFVEDGQVIVGYEEERLSEIKSDSAFPSKAIKIITDSFCSKFDNCVIGHWFTSGVLSDCKYINYDILDTLIPGRHEIYSLKDGFTHHDSHCVAAESFYNIHSKQQLNEGDYAIVADGFGTFGENLTVYKYFEDGLREIVTRVFDYKNSLGLLYQYTTLFLGMKMNNHEYKMLGYEAHIHEVINAKDFETLDMMASHAAGIRFEDLFELGLKDTDPIVNVNALDFVKKQVFANMELVCDHFKLSDDNLYQKRVVISYYVQAIVERVMVELVESLAPKTLLVSGGLFYNVKLNNVLSKRVNQLCILPLAGDQGAGLGIYQHYFGDLKFPRDLSIGHRNLNWQEFEPEHSHIEDNSVIETFGDLGKLLHTATSVLANQGIVNIVLGSMEFGPRALGSTSTIAIPTTENIELINKLNDRTFVMPMAPMMLLSQMRQYATSGFNIVGSNEYMVSTVDVIPEAIEDFPGGIHRYKDVATCRPQLVDDHPIYSRLCKEFGPLINTSFNYHGVPIVFNEQQIIHSHNAQAKNAKGELTVTTLVYVGN